MLNKLKILNFAILKNIEFNPQIGLNVITGETGSGKSLLIDAINLVLGKRTDYKFKDNQNEKCIIEANFSYNNNLKKLFIENDLDIDENIIIRREILNSGKSRAFINDTPVQINLLKQIGEKLISIHSQFDNSDIINPNFHYKILDNENQDIFKKFTENHKLFKNLKNEKIALEQSISSFLKEKDYLKYLYDELDKLDLKLNEEKELEDEINLLSNAENIQKTALQTENIISEGEFSLIENFNSLKQIIKSVANTNSNFKDIYERLSSIQIELKDISSEIDKIKEFALSNPERLDELNQRLNEIQMLKRKHQVSEIENLLEIKETLFSKINGFAINESSLLEVDEKIEKTQKLLDSYCEKLTNNRIKKAKVIENKIKEYLKLLEMPNCEFEYNFIKTEQFNSYGKDDVEILFSANKGISKQHLGKSASGGEISRLALCLRAIESEKNIEQTYIFDEIDTGVSGKVASQIGQMMTTLSEKNQLICITHIPQVAGYAKLHFHVSKQIKDEMTVSNLTQLSSDDRVEILASMLSSENATLIAKENAKELIKN